MASWPTVFLTRWLPRLVIKRLQRDSAGAESKIACTSTIDPERRYMKKLDLIIILAYI